MTWSASFLGLMRKHQGITKFLCVSYFRVSISNACSSLRPGHQIPRAHSCNDGLLSPQTSDPARGIDPSQPRQNDQAYFFNDVFFKNL
jgi:hypothetical protein